MKILDMVRESYRILKNLEDIKNIAVNGSMDEKISLERELSDLLDTGTSNVKKENQHKYIQFFYGFCPLSSLVRPIENAYALVKDSYIENDEKMRWFMDARIPIEVVPEKIKSDSESNGTTTGSTWYILKENIRIFGFTYESFRELFYKAGSHHCFPDTKIVDRNTNEDLGTIRVDVTAIISEDYRYERNAVKKGDHKEKQQMKEQKQKEEEEKRKYLQLHEKYR